MDNEVTIEQEIATVEMKRPHVVVLGAGASRAACLNGDKNGNRLPLMRDLTEIIDLKTILKKWGINSDQNFEEIFSDLHAKGESEKMEEIQKIVDEYFSKLELPDKPTIYDHLILSLRGTDLIATFNWDPLLLQAYTRNSNLGLSLPRLAFLHGNVGVGYCEKDKKAGMFGDICKKCNKPYNGVPLLYPIKSKNYSENFFIANEWNQLKRGFTDAFMITIFGYSGPKTDQEAISAMKEAWGDKNQRSMEQTCFITTQSEEVVSENWDSFIHTHHYEVSTNFYESWISNHPRRTGEAYISQYLDAKFINNNPIPKDAEFPELWEWYGKFRNAEKV